MEVKIKRIHPKAVIPSYAHQHDAAMDLTAISKTLKEKYVEYKTGISIEVPPGYVGLIFPRSSISKYDLSLCNAVGVIDCGYLGEISLRFDYDHALDKLYKVGDRIGQIMFIPRPSITFVEADDLGTSERGSGGFGSSGT